VDWTTNESCIEGRDTDRVLFVLCPLNERGIEYYESDVNRVKRKPGHSDTMHLKISSSMND